MISIFTEIRLFLDSIVYYKKENERLNKLLVKERAQREKVDKAAIDFLKQVKLNYENKIESLTNELSLLKKENEEMKQENENCKKENDILKKTNDQLSSLKEDPKKEIEEPSSDRLKQIKFDLRMAQREVSKQKDQIEYLRSARKEAQDEAKALRLQVEEKEKEVLSNETECKNLMAKLDSTEAEKMKLIEEVKSSDEKIEELKIKYEKLKKLNSTLKETCSTVESQVGEFQSLYEGQKDIKMKLSEEKQQMSEKINKLENDLEVIEKKYSIQVIEMTQHINDLKNELSVSQEKTASLDSRLKEKEEELSKEKQFHIMHAKDIPDLILQNEQQASMIESLNEKLQAYHSDLCNLKEEASVHITKIANLNTQNKNLAKGLEESLNKCETLQNRIDIILNELETRQTEHDMEKLRLNETVHQQLKLIDLLQEKVEKLKKPWIGFNSPASKVQNPTLNATRSNDQIKKLEAAFEREITKNKMLIQEIDETKNELKHYKRESKC